MVIFFPGPVPLSLTYVKSLSHLKYEPYSFPPYKNMPFLISLFHLKHLLMLFNGCIWNFFSPMILMETKTKNLQSLFMKILAQCLFMNFSKICIWQDLKWKFTYEFSSYIWLMIESLNLNYWWPLEVSTKWMWLEQGPHICILSFCHDVLVNFFHVKSSIVLAHI